MNSRPTITGRGALRGRIPTWIVGLTFILGVAFGPAHGDGSLARPKAAAPVRYKAVAFDYLVLFNPDSIVSVAETVFPGQGRALTNLWRTRQFEYCWLRLLTGRYVDFSAVTGDALVYAARMLKLQLTAAQKQLLIEAYLHLSPWPDSIDSLRRLRDAGVRVITITNFSPAMLRSNAVNAGMLELFDALLSTDLNHTYKPDPRAYQLGLDRLHVSRQDIVFAAFAGWDAAGAKAFGYPTVWVNRFKQPLEELGVRPDREVASLDGLLEFVLGRPIAH